MTWWWKELCRDTLETRYEVCPTHAGVLRCPPAIAVTEPWWTRNMADNMKDVHSVQEFVDELVRRCLAQTVQKT